MFDFGDEFAIDNFRGSWLLWVQLIVMILLVAVLLCGFTIFALDRSGDFTCNQASSSSSSSPPSSSQSNSKDPLLNDSISKVASNQRILGEAEASASKGMIEDEIQGEHSSEKDIALFRVLKQGGQHPCEYFNFAKQAVLKCFGLGNTSESRHSNEHKKEDCHHSNELKKED